MQIGIKWDLIVPIIAAIIVHLLGAPRWATAAVGMIILIQTFVSTGVLVLIGEALAKMEKKR